MKAKFKSKAIFHLSLLFVFCLLPVSRPITVSAQEVAATSPFGLVTGSGSGSFGPLGLTLLGSGANEWVSIDPVTGTTAIVGAGLPSGIHNFAATLDLTGSRYFYRTGGNLIVVDTQTGTLLGSLPLPENLISLDFDPVSGTLFGLVTGSGTGWSSLFGLTLLGSGANELVSIDPATGTTTIVGAGLPSGIHNFAATLDPTGSRYFYRTGVNLDGANITGGNLIVVDTQTGALLGQLPVPDNFLSITVASGIEDTTPPELVSFTVSPLVVDTSTGSASVSVRIEARDDISGLDRGGWSTGQLSFRHTSESNAVAGVLLITGGTNLEPIFEFDLTFPQLIGIGNHAK